MVCLSESPLEHLRWLVSDRGWPPWGLLVRRQTVFDRGGGPVWYARNGQLAGVPESLRGWAVRFETGLQRSEWLHEREWRVPVPDADPALLLPPGSVTAILIGDPTWRPTQVVRQTLYVNESGAPVQPGEPGHPVWADVPELPTLWTGASQHWFWDQEADRSGRYPTARFEYAFE